MRVSKEFTKVGEFWLPGLDHKKTQGELKVIDGGRIELVVYSALGGRFLNGSRVGRVVGLVEDFGYVTLDGCYYKSKRGTIGDGKAKSLLGAKFLYVGRSFEAEAVLAKELCFSVEELDLWIGITGINVDWDDDGYNEVRVTYKSVDDIVLSLGDKFILRISFSSILPSSSSIKEVKISQKVWLVIQSNEAVSVECLIDKARELTTFISLGLDQVASLQDVTLSLKGSKIDYKDVVKIFFESRPFAEVGPDMKLHDPVFDFDFVRGGMESYLSNWSGCYENISPVISLYFGVKMGTYRYLDARFLALAQGLESLHRRTYDRKMMSEDEFAELKEKIIAGCPSDRREWLSGRLAYANEISLAQRLRDLIEPLKEIFGTDADVKKFVRSMVDTRNFYTHFDKSGKKYLAEGVALVALVDKMELLLYLNILILIGFEIPYLRMLVSSSFSLHKKLQDSYEAI